MTIDETSKRIRPANRFGCASKRQLVLFGCIFLVTLGSLHCERRKHRFRMPVAPRSMATLIAKKHGIRRNQVTNQQLAAAIQRISDTQLHRFGGISRVRCDVSQDIRTAGQYQHPANVLTIHADYARDADILVVYQIILHEMVHAWVFQSRGGETHQKCNSEDGGASRHKGHCTTFYVKACELGLDESDTARQYGMQAEYDRLVERGICPKKSVPVMLHVGSPEENIKRINEEIRNAKFGEPLENWPHFPRNYLELL
jgi:hypothetical protein